VHVVEVSGEELERTGKCGEGLLWEIIGINIVIQDLKNKRSCRCKKFTLNHNK
jgi:hypothetical protein